MVPVSARLATKPARLFSVPRALLLAALLFAAWPSMAEAQYFPENSIPEPFNDQTTSGVVLLGRPGGYLGPYADTGYFGPYLSLQHVAGDGPGYRDNGYTTLGLFVPRKAGSGILFGDGRLSVDDFGELIGNIGGGYRYYSASQNRIYGGSLWYDVDAGHRSTFSQGGVSLETRGQNWDFFINGYFPIDDDPKQFNRTVTPSGISVFGFSGVNLAVNQPNVVTRQAEVAMAGFDAELGGPLPIVGKYGIRGYGGYYHYENDNVTDIDGGRFRLQADFTDSLVGQFMLTNDNQFDTSAIFSIAWTLPGNGAARGEWNRPGVNRSGRTFVRAQSPDGDNSIRQYYRMFQPTQRNNRLFVSQSNTTTLEDNIRVITDPDTGQPIVIFHMDSRGPLGGDGSFENPFANPQEAQAGTGTGDIIFTHAGSVFDDPANNFIALQQNQQLLGEGPTYVINTDELGPIAIPPSGDAGGFPTIQGAGGPAAITLANGSTVSAFNINDSVNAGILADAGLTAGNSASVQNTTITGGPIGLSVTGAAGTVNFESTSAIVNTTMAGLSVTGGATTGTVNVNGTITNAAGQSFFIDSLQPGGIVNLNGQVTATGGTGSVIQNSAGIVNVANASLMNIDAGSTGLLLDNNPNGAIRFGQIDIMTNDGPAFVARDSGDLTVNNGTLVANGGPALFLDDDGTGNPFMVNIRLNDVTSNNSAAMGNSGIHIEDVTGTVAITGTATIDTPGGNGIEFIDSAADVAIAMVNIDDTVGSGIFLQDTSGAMPDLLTGSLTINGGSIDGSMGPSFNVMAGSATTLYQGNINHTVAGSEIVSIQDTSAAANNVFNTGTLTSTAGDGILLSNADGNASFMGTTLINRPGMADTTTRGVLINNGSTGTFFWGPNSTINDTTGNAFEINASAPTSTYGGVINQSLAARAVEISDLQAGGQASFTGTVNATAASTGFRIIDSEGNVNVNNYIAGVRATPARLMNTALEINNSTGVHQFENLDLFTDGGNGVLITGNGVQQGTFGVTTGRIDTINESAIDITNTNLSTVLFTEVIAANTGGGANHGVSLNNAGNGTFTISDGDDMTMMDLNVSGTGGADGIRITGLLSNSTFNISSADISNTGGGIAINIFDTPAFTNFGKVTIDGTATAAGIALINTTGDHTFGATTITDTGGGVGVQMTNVGGSMTNMTGDITFDDGDITTSNDLNITNTGGGDGVDILNPMDSAVITIAGANIGGAGALGLGGGNGIHITGADGVITLGDMFGVTPFDVTINNTGGGDGIRIEDPMTTAMITASTVNISNTGAGNGLNILNGDGMIAFGDGDDATTMDLNIDTMGAGNGINIVDSMATSNFTFSTVDIATAGTGINIMGTAGVTAQGMITFNDGVDDDTIPDVDIATTGAGSGIAITSSGAAANFSFASVDIAATGAGNGVTILGTAGDPALGTIAFGDGDATTTNDLEITTNTGNGIDIIGTGAGGNFTFSSVDIAGTAGGNGVSIGDPANLLTTLGNITFNDGSGATTDDLTITNTAGGDGLIVQNSGPGTVFTFSSIDISNTGAGNGVSLIDNTSVINILGGDIRDAGGTAFFVDGGDQNVTYSGTISGNTAGLLVDIQNRAGGTVDFNGAMQSTGAGGGIRLGNATAANTVRFDGAVNLGINNADGLARLTGGGNAVDIDHNGTASSVVFADLDIFTNGRTGLTSAAGSMGNIAVTTGRINTIDAQAIVLNDINMNNITLTDSGIFSALTVLGAGGVGNNAVDFNNVTGNFTVNGNNNNTGTVSITAGASGFLNGIDVDGGTATYDINSNGATGETVVISGATGDAVSMANTTGGSLSIDNLVATTIGMSALDLDMNTNSSVTLTNAMITNTGATSIAINDGVNNDFTFNGGTLTQTANAVTTVGLTNLDAASAVTFNATSTINATMGDGLQFNNVDGTNNFLGTVTLNGGDAGIDILGDSDGTFTFAATTSITNPTGVAFNVVGDTTNSPTITYSGTIANNAGAAVNIQDTMGGTITFNSADANAITDSAGGIVLNNVGSNVNFTADTELTGATGIDIDGGSGTFTFTDTDITDLTGAAGIDINGGSANVNFQANSSVTQSANDLLLVNVSGGHTGTVTFAGSGNATMGDGLEFNNADGTYNFTGTTSLSGGDAGIDILTGSDGTFTFSANTSIAGRTDDAFTVVGDGTNNPTVTYTGTIANTAGNVILIQNTAGGTVTFNSAAVNAITDSGTGIVLNGVGSNVNFTSDIELTGTSGIDIDGGSGTFTFTDTDINVTGPAFDVSGGTASVNFLTNSSLTQNSANVTVSVLNHATGTIDFDGDVTDNAGKGLIFNNADGTYRFDGTNTLEGTNGIDIVTGSTGTFTFGTTSIDGVTGDGVEIDGHGTGTVTFGNLAINAVTGNGIDIDNSTGTYNFTGATNSISNLAGAADGIQVTQAAGTYNFSNFAITGLGAQTGISFSNLGGGAANLTLSANSVTGAAGGTGYFIEADTNDVTLLNSDMAANNNTTAGVGTPFNDNQANGGAIVNQVLINGGLMP